MAFPIKKKKKVAPLCLFWTIWRERNKNAFENRESLDQTFKSSFFYLFWNWARLYSGNGSMSLLDFVDRLGSS